MAKTAEVSPFTPGQPVPVELFIGRREQVDELSDRALEAARGRLQIAFLVGERGIGKTSLAAFAGALAEIKHNLVVVHVLLGGTHSIDEMVRQVFDRLVKEGNATTWFERVRELFGEHIEEVGLFGVQIGFAPKTPQLRRIRENFPEALAKIIERLEGARKGLFIVLDDINGLARSEEFANWLKSFVDQVATSGPQVPLMLLLVGQEEMRRNLVGLQPSLARVFHLFEIKPWSDDETRSFYRKAFDSVGMSISDDALAFMVAYAGGLPVLAHEIGDAAFRADTDDRITAGDARRGIAAAADIVGRKHLEPQVLDSIRSPRYRAILRKIPVKEGLGIIFKRSQALQYLDDDEANVFDNFLRKMCDLGVLTRAADRGQGWYRFTSDLHWLYFWFEGVRANELEVIEGRNDSN